uniref:Uncharacterized protein n=1 Tax=Rangifer tarandus platyrhynchus TaxID=3082113 RepID=A0ACB0ENG2_RANTA|nr:unnamed protein product [Rangifer tarandus platyrhynchus]
MRVLWSLPRRVLRSRPVRLGGRIPGRRRAPHSQALTALAPGLQRPPPSCQAPHHTWNNHKEQLQRPGPPAVGGQRMGFVACVLAAESQGPSEGSMCWVGGHPV